VAVHGSPRDRTVRRLFEAGQRLEFPARPRYRTVARGSTSRAAGRHRCVVRKDDGTVLLHADFEITE
jgi:hypothetical protein